MDCVIKRSAELNPLGRPRQKSPLIPAGAIKWRYYVTCVAAEMTSLYGQISLQGHRPSAEALRFTEYRNTGNDVDGSSSIGSAIL